MAAFLEDTGGNHERCRHTGSVALNPGANDANCPGPLSSYLRIDTKRGRFEVDQRAFMDEETFRLEREKIFSKCWLFVGHDSEIPQPKDFLTRNIGGFDLIFNRDRDGKGACVP